MPEDTPIKAAVGRIADELERRIHAAPAEPTAAARLLRAVHALLAGEIAGLVLSGRTGSGKTTAARVIAARALDCYDTTPRFVARLGYDLSHRVIRALRVRASSEEDLRALDTASGARRCYIDDLGFDRPTVAYGNRRDPVGDYLVRWGDTPDRGRLLVTTNLDADGIRARYDDRVLSRLVASCGWLRFDAADHRLSNLRKF